MIFFLPAIGYALPRCSRPPPGWRCTRESGHDGPCAALPEPGLLTNLRAEADLLREHLKSMTMREISLQGEAADLRSALSRSLKHSSDLLTRVKMLELQVEELLHHCPDGECSYCARVICPHSEPLHFHHDGCPACDVPVFP